MEDPYPLVERIERNSRGIEPIVWGALLTVNTYIGRRSKEA